jgi:hypothetical protein
MASVAGIRLNRNIIHSKVLVRSLQSILEENEINHVHFFSLDTEGYELQILNGVDFTKTTFDYLLIEIYDHDYEQIINLLSNNGYDMIQNFTMYNERDNPGWGGNHNDYLFKNRLGTIKK